MNRIAAALGVVVAVISAAVLWIGFGGEAPSPPPPEAEQRFELRFGHNLPIDSALHDASVLYAERVAEKSGGRVRVSVHPAQQLGTDHQMIEAVRAGDLDILITPTAKMSALVPPLQYADLPFLFPTPEDAHALLDGEPGRLLLKTLEPYGMVGATFWENGFKHFTADRPIRSPEDFRGLNIRVMKSRIIMEQFLAFDANPIPIDFHATRQALADGVVNGQENPLVAIVNMGFHEVQSDLTLSNHAYLPYVFVFSKRVYDGLPADIREILYGTARELAPLERADTARREEKFLQTIRAAGVAVHTLDAEQRERFQSRTRHVVDSYRGVIGSEIMDKTREYLAAKYGVPEQPPELIVGLNANMSLGSSQGGLAIKRGMELAVAEINRAGGVLGRRLAIVVKDNAGIPARGVANFNSLAETPNLVAVVGGKRSPVVEAQLDAIHEQRIPFLIPWAAAASLVDNGREPNFVFRISARSDLSGAFLAERALAKSGSVALLVENTLWGRSNHEAMVAELAKRGVKPVAVEWFNLGVDDFTPQLTRFEQAGAGVVLYGGDVGEGIALVKSMAARERLLPILSNWGVTGGRLWEECREELKRVELEFFQTVSFLESGRPARDALAAAYLAAYGGEGPASIPSPAAIIHAYDLIHLLAKAIQHAGSSNGEAVRRALENLGPHQGAAAYFESPFTAERHDALGWEDYRMAVYDERGAIVPLEGQ